MIFFYNCVVLVALVDPRNGEYILNGNHIVSQFLKDVVYAGTTIKYSGSENVVEKISTPKHQKLTADLVLEVLSVGLLLPPDISYRYIIEKINAPKYVSVFLCRFGFYCCFVGIRGEFLIIGRNAAHFVVVSSNCSVIASIQLRACKLASNTALVSMLLERCRVAAATTTASCFGALRLKGVAQLIVVKGEFS